VVDVAVDVPHRMLIGKENSCGRKIYNGGIRDIFYISTG
jgi:hypothetical protein